MINISRFFGVFHRCGGGGGGGLMCVESTVFLSIRLKSMFSACLGCTYTCIYEATKTRVVGAT